LANVSHLSDVPSTKDESIYNPYLPSLKIYIDITGLRKNLGWTYPPPNDRYELSHSAT
jgi:hypothetical protein